MKFYVFQAFPVVFIFTETFILGSTLFLGSRTLHFLNRLLT